MAAPLFAGRYRLRDTLSSTTMAEVWLATDSELDRQVVVKLLASGADRGRFEREARAAAGLSHPNIVQLFDFGEEGGRPYMVFEYLAGGSLEDRLVNGDRLTSDEVTTVAGEVAAGLAHAHEHGVVHRDLKPGNVLFDGEGRSKIADFGIARVLGTDTLTDAGTVLGTAAYISPEQVRGELATPASDVYSFGVILYRLLAGRLPFEAESPTELARLHRDAEPPPLPPVREELRRPAAVATSALAKEPAERPADGTALVRSLEGGAVADAATTRILPPPVAPTRFPRRRLALLAAIAILVIAAAGLLAAIVLSGGQASAPATPVHSATTAPTTTRTSTPSTTTAPSTTASSTTTTTRHTQPATTTTHPTTTHPPTTTLPLTTAVPPVTTAATTVPTLSLPTTTAP